MTPRGSPLTMYGSPAGLDEIAWSWVDDQLTGADFYWVVAAEPERPVAARPVWGVWWEQRLLLSVGSPRVRAALDGDGPVTVHLGSGLDVVIVEGVPAGTSGDAAAVRAYDDKYEWDYDLERYGPFTVVAPAKVMAWQSSGPAGRGGFTGAGRWTFDR
jgi:hypothetical protein